VLGNSFLPQVTDAPRAGPSVRPSLAYEVPFPTMCICVCVCVEAAERGV